MGVIPRNSQAVKAALSTSNQRKGGEFDEMQREGVRVRGPTAWCHTLHD